MTSKSIEHKLFSQKDFYRSKDGRPEDGGAGKVSWKDFNSLGLGAFADGLSFRNKDGYKITEESFFLLNNKVGAGAPVTRDGLLSRGEALMGIAAFDDDYLANSNVPNIDEHTVSDYLKTADRKYGKNTTQYENALQYLFSAIEGFSDTSATDLANALRGNTVNDIMDALGFNQPNQGVLDKSDLDDALSQAD